MTGHIKREKRIVPSGAWQKPRLEVFAYIVKKQTFMVRNRILENGKFSIIELERKKLVMGYGKS